MSHISRRVVFVVLLMVSSAAAIVLAAAISDPLAASGPDFTGFPCPSNPAFTCVMSGLHNPRGLAFGPGRRHKRHHRDALYVAEAGCGGNTSDCQVPAPVSSCKDLPFAGRVVRRCFGLTGSISRPSRGKQERVATGFP